MMTHHYFFIFNLFLLIFTSCGNDKGQTSINRTEIQEDLIVAGNYRAILRPLNNHLSGFIPSGIAEVNIRGDLIKVKTILDDDARVKHIQNLHIGERCPRPFDDTNKDGVIDSNEARKISGEILIPLDRDLNSIQLGEGLFPFGSKLTYVESASLENLINDLRINRGIEFNPKNKAVLIHGVSLNTKLPETVTTFEQHPSQLSVPIACGVLQKIE